MSRRAVLVLAAGLLAGSPVSASASARIDAWGDGSRVGATHEDRVRGNPRDDPAVFFLAGRSSRGACASLAREEREARKRGDWWRADQLQDAYRDCLKRGG
jgi:hypothetical protein